MRLFRLKIGTWALICALLSSQTVCSLAAYSETRSSRDALEGSSMDGATGGAVDKMTSSYGDRTTGSNGGSAYQNGARSISPMMLANGNTMAQQQQQTTEDEREMGPTDGVGMNGQQRVKTEQNVMMNGRPMSSARQSTKMTPAKASSNGRNLRPQQQVTDESYASGKTSSSPSIGFGEEQTKTKQPRGRQSASMAPRQKSLEMVAQANGYSDNQSADGNQQQTEDSSDQQQQQQQMMNGASNMNGYSNNNGEDQQQEMQTRPMNGNKAPTNARSSMYMSMNGGNGYSMNSGSSSQTKYMKQSQMPMSMQQTRQYDDRNQKQPNSMAQNMIMSLANKAAYANSQKGQQQMSQRQEAPQMMMMVMTPTQSSSMAGNYARENGFNDQSPVYKSNSMSGMNGMMTRGDMRRDNQRMPQLPMSPAMMNAMLNKLLNAKQQQPESVETSNYVSEQMKQIIMNQPMTTLVNAMATMSPTKRDQYKRMMVAAIVQQQQESESGNGMDKLEQDQEQQQQQELPMNGKQAMTAAAGEGTENGYTAPQAMPMMNSMLMAMAKQQKSMQMNGMGTNGAYGDRSADRTSLAGNAMNGYGQDTNQQAEQQQRQLMNGGMSMQMSDSYSQGGQRQQMQQQQQQQMSPIMMVMMNGAGKMGSNNGDYGSPMMMGPRMVQAVMKPTKTSGPAMDSPRGYGETTTPSSYSQQQEMDQPQAMTPAMGSAKRGENPKPMNGFRLAYNQADQQQQQQDDRAENESPSSSYESTPRPMNGIKGNQQRSNNYPMTSSMARPIQQKPEASAYDSQQQASGADQQQTTDEYGSSPMGQAEPFAFDYKVEDDYGNNQYRKEESDTNGVVRGSYGFMDTKGMYRHVEYVADENGFRAKIKSNEPGLSTEPAKRTGTAPGANGRGTSTMAMAVPMMNGGAEATETQQMPEGDGNSQAQMPMDLGSSVDVPQQRVNENGTK